MSSLPARSLDRIFELLVQTDALVAKAVGISEVGQIARIETRLREYLQAQWDKVKRDAIDEAVRMGRAGKTAAQISKEVINRLNKWSGLVEKEFKRSMSEVYRKSRIASFRKVLYRSKQELTYDTPNFESVEKADIPRAAVVRPMFDVVDERAVDALENQHTFWVKEHVDKNLSQSIQKTVKETMIEAGKGRVEAGKLLREALTKELGQVRTPLGWNGSERQYFEGLAANAATTARVQGHMRSFVDLGIKTYEIVNPQDERTCPVCNFMDGKVFTVDQGTKVIEAEMSATTPEGVQDAHPWYSFKELKEISKGPGNQNMSDADALTSKGYAIPPFHYRCRCTITVTGETGPSQIDETPPAAPGQRTRAPKWKPVMPKKQAKSYTQDSRLKQDFYHGTSTAARLVSKAGLVAKTAKNNSHAGITLMRDKAKAKAMAPKGTTVSALANVENPLRTTPEFWKGVSKEPAHVAVYDALPKRIKPKKATIGQLSKAAQKVGYDGWYLQEKGKLTELRVFDKKQVAITSVD